MPAQTDNPKVFISYSWNPPQHKERVIEFAKRLRSDGVDVILDVWDLAPGQDKNLFMEQTVTNPDIKKVLLVCNKSYKQKADGRQGGVGTESLIMSKEVYAKADQTKFIPLVFEFDEQGEACVPTFIHSRIFFDLRDGDGYEAAYEQLLRDIFSRPTYTRPPIGVRPGYLDSEAPSTLPTAHRVVAIRRAFSEERRNAPLLVKQYYVSFLKALSDFEPKEGEFTNDNFIELTLARMEQMRPLRDDFVSFLETYLEVSPEFDQESIEAFFEKLVTYFFPKAVSNYHVDYLNSLQFDYLRFFVYELFLYFTSILLKVEKFEILGPLLHYTFIVIREQADPLARDFRILNMYVATLNKHQDARYEMRRQSVVADNIKSRTTVNHDFDSLKQADILLHHIAELSGFIPNAHSRSYWRPETSAYDMYKLPILTRMVSQRYFDKIKVLFSVETKEELKQKVEELENDSFTQLWHRGDYARSRNIPMLSELINIEKLCTVK
jgi:hypothetical protein